jgi:hypothetical protein
MSMRSFSVSAGIALLVGMAAAGSARTQEIQVSGDLAEKVGQIASQQSAAWIGYEIPLVAEIGGICCGPGAACKLERAGEPVFERSKAGSPHPNLVILLRADKGKIGEVRAYSADCALDAGKLPVSWLRGVRPEDSVALLSTFVTPGAPRELVFRTIFAISAHAGPAAEDLLLRTVLGKRDTGDPAMRGRALLLYTNRMGDRALPMLSELLAGDDPELRSSALLSVMQLPQETKLEVLKDLEHNSADREIRRRAELLLKVAEGRPVIPDLELAN